MWKREIRGFLRKLPGQSPGSETHCLISTFLSGWGKLWASDVLLGLPLVALQQDNTYLTQSVRLVFPGSPWPQSQCRSALASNGVSGRRPAFPVPSHRKQATWGGTLTESHHCPQSSCLSQAGLGEGGRQSPPEVSTQHSCRPQPSLRASLVIPRLQSLLRF